MEYKFINCQDGDYQYKMGYSQWGNLNNPNVLICVHGLTRNCRDFDYLAKELSQDFLVICPDIVGRGKSDYLKNPKNYGFPLYIKNLLNLINTLNLTNINWLGSSMGGIIGILITAMENNPIKRLILNDVGAFIDSEQIRKIADYMALETTEFATFEEGLVYIKKVHQQFGNLTAEMWQHLAENSLKLAENGVYKLHYDPQISVNFQGDRDNIKDVNLWSFWERINCPILLLHGEQSNLLTLEIIAKMEGFNKEIKAVTFPNCGHVPSLMFPEQIEIIKQWLLKKTLISTLLSL